MVFDLSTILLLQAKEFGEFLKSFIRSKGISGNKLGLMMGASRAMGHKYLKGNSKREKRREILAVLGEDEALRHYAEINGIQTETNPVSTCAFSSKVVEYFKDIEKYVALINAQVEDGEFEMAVNSMAMCAQHAERQFEKKQAVERPREKNPQQSDMDERVQSGEDTFSVAEEDSS